MYYSDKDHHNAVDVLSQIIEVYILLSSIFKLNLHHHLILILTNVALSMGHKFTGDAV